MTDPVHSDINACYPGIVARGSAEVRLVHLRNRFLAVNVYDQAIRLDAGMIMWWQRGEIRSTQDFILHAATMTSPLRSSKAIRNLNGI